ncbi:hypothetical protein FWJ25_04660 [Marinobacter salinexigens]|uniref:Alpha/beta hydrolase n=1 Tax=Marinobacter salinexigens TaxID=2919747 RepID=A0A5B0VJ80_9GAMM|nr:hypothetical protein [Marinobacter salinexigens]KAA1174686.1 hypothetical protein FWJ25_04660 [Marinobacter salinexigens]
MIGILGGYMKVLLDNDFIKISVRERSSKNVVLCFTGIGHAMGAVDVQGEEFFNISSMATTVFIIDKQRSWGNNFDFLELRELLSPYTEGKVVFSLGNSMGGFLSILASKFFDVRSVVAFVPQFSVSPKVVPDERRWRRYVDNIKAWRYESLDGAFLDGVNYYIISAVNDVELIQLKLFPDGDNVRKIIFYGDEFGHNVAAPLKKVGALYGVIDSCFKGECVWTILDDLKGVMKGVDVRPVVDYS